jgi:hypothetical protein
MIFAIAIVGCLCLGVGYAWGRAAQYSNARERLRLRVMESNINGLSENDIQRILDEL